MKNTLLALILLTVSLASPQLHATPEPTYPELIKGFAAVVLVIPATLYALGVFWTTVCEGAGYEFYINDNNDWVCSGNPLNKRT